MYSWHEAEGFTEYACTKSPAREVTFSKYAKSMSDPSQILTPGFQQPDSHRCTYIRSAEQIPEHILMEYPEPGFGGKIKEVDKNVTFMVLQSGRLKAVSARQSISLRNLTMRIIVTQEQ